MNGMIELNRGGHRLFVNPRYVVECGEYPDGSHGCWIRVEGAPARYHFDGRVDDLKWAFRYALEGKSG